MNKLKRHLETCVIFIGLTVIFIGLIIVGFLFSALLGFIVQILPEGWGLFVLFAVPLVAAIYAYIYSNIDKGEWLDV